jgi:SPP1 gp7 family putative phage head morphogenesis protein
VITLAQLLHRRRVTASAAKRRPARKVPPQLRPNAAIATYTRVLLDLSAQMDHVIYQTLRDADIVRIDEALPRHVISRLQHELEQLTSSRFLVAKIVRVAETVGDHTGQEFRRQVQRSLGVSLLAEPNLAALVDAFRIGNLKLITSLAHDKVERVRKILADAPEGTRHEELARQIREQTGATRSRAALIARTETLKLNAQMTQARHVEAGIKEARWSTARDERTRPSHRAMEGAVFSYDKLPVVDGVPTLPGTPPNCRCLAIPILPAL